MPPTTYRLKLSPRGMHAGLVAFAGHGLALTVLVLPKAWRETKSDGELRHVLGAPDAPAGLAVIGYELDDIVLVAETAIAEAFLAEVRALLDEEAETREREGRAAVKKRSGAWPQPATAPELVRLRGISEKARKQVAPAVAASASHAEVASGLLDLAHLAARADREGRATRCHDTTEDGVAHSIGVEGGEVLRDVDALLLLEQLRYVDLLEERLQRFRRGYQSVEESSSFVRGRITARGRLQWAAGGQASIECEHDVFTEATPLQRVLVTALEVVANGALAARVQLTEWALVTELRRRATHVRRLLGTVPSLPRAEAAQGVRRLRLTALQRDWAPALDLARAILLARPPREDTSARGTRGYQWAFDTARLWEQVVEQVVEAWRPDNWSAPRNQFPHDAPWQGLNKRKPDVVAWSDSHAVVFDAKYKLGTPLGRGDADQAFLASILVEVETGARVRRVVLVLPEADADDDDVLDDMPEADEGGAVEQRFKKTKDGFQRKELPGSSLPTCKLLIQRLQFPQRGALRRDAWTGHIQKLAGGLPTV